MNHHLVQRFGTVRVCRVKVCMVSIVLVSYTEIMKQKFRNSRDKYMGDVLGQHCVLLYLF